VQRRRDWSTIAALTQDVTVQAAVRTMVVARASLGLNSRVFQAGALTLQTTVFAGGATVLVDQALTPGQDRTVTRDGGAAAPFTGVVAGDIVTIASVAYVVASWISNQTVTLTTSATAGALQTLNSVVHPLTTQQQVDAYGQAAQALAAESVSVVFPPNPTWNSVVVPGYLLAAATAGLRGFTMPQQSTKGALMESGWGVPQSVYEFFPFLTQLAQYGCFVYDTAGQQDTGGVVVSFANTTDQSSTIHAREALVADVYAVTRYLQDVVSCFVGTVKVTGTALDRIRADLSSAIEYLRTNTAVSPFGAVIVSGSIGTPIQDPVLLDVVIVPVTITIATDVDAVVLNITVSIAGV
jgi:hypothetical protein